VRWRLKDLAARAMARSGVSVSVSAMWRTVRDHRYGYGYLSAASRAGDPCAVGHVRGRANTDGMDVHPEMVPAKVRSGNHAVVVPDGAGWHRSRAPVVPGNVSLPHLPPHSPEPDPAGQVLDHLRPNFLSNRPFPTVGDVTGAMRDARETFGTDLERIASVTKRSWARVR